MHRHGPVLAPYSTTRKTVREVLERNNLTIADIDWLVPHQANRRILTSVADHLGFPMVGFGNENTLGIQESDSEIGLNVALGGGNPQIR